MPKAFRALDEGATEAECSKEVSFAEMFASLGKPGEQHIIRQKNQGKHCELLIQNSNACLDCPRNPHKDATRGPLIEAYRQAADILEHAVHLSKLAALGLLPEDITPAELEMAWQAQRWQDRRDRHELAVEVINELARAMAKKD